MFVVGNVEVSRVLLDGRVAERGLSNPELIVGKVGVLDKLVWVLPLAHTPRSIVQRLTQQAVLLHKSLSIYPLVDLHTSLAQPELVMDTTQNDLRVGNKRRENSREEDERQQAEYPHRRSGSWQPNPRHMFVTGRRQHTERHRSFFGNNSPSSNRCIYRCIYPFDTLICCL